MEVLPLAPYNDVRMLPGVLAFRALHYHHREHNAIHPYALLPELPRNKNYHTPGENRGEYAIEDN